MSWFPTIYSWGNTVGILHYWVTSNLTVICCDLAKVFGRPVLAVLDLLSLCLHSGPMGPPQHWQVRWTQDLPLLSWFQHVRTRNFLLGAWAEFAFKRFLKWGKWGNGFGDAIRKDLHFSGQFEHCAL